MAHHPREYRRPAKPSAGTGRRVALILVACGITAGIVSLVSAPATRSIAPPPPPQLMGRMSAPRMQEYAADNAVVQGALAADKELIALRRERHSNSDPMTDPHVVVRAADPVGTRRVSMSAVGTLPRDPAAMRSPAAIHLAQVRSKSPHETRERALDDALTMARDRLLAEFREADPPVHATPSTDDVRAKYLRADSVTEVLPAQDVQDAWKAANLDPNRVWVEVDVEVTADQLRELRAGYRLGWTAWVVAAILVMVVVVHGFLRVDAWTKGYLTTALALAAAAAAGGGMALIYLLRSSGQ